MMRVLVTGFGPFQHIAANPSLLLVEGLSEAAILPDRIELHRAILPVVYGVAGEQIRVSIQPANVEIRTSDSLDLAFPYAA